MDHGEVSAVTVRLLQVVRHQPEERTNDGLRKRRQRRLHRLLAVAWVGLVLFPSESTAKRLDPQTGADPIIDTIEAHLDPHMDVASHLPEIALPIHRPVVARLSGDLYSAEHQLPDDFLPELRRGALGALLGVKTSEVGKPTSASELKALWSGPGQTQPGTARKDKVFLSFARSDFELANRTKTALEAAGFQTFMYLTDPAVAPPFSELEVGRMFREADHRLVIHTDRSKVSPGVTVEKLIAREYEAFASRVNDQIDSLAKDAQWFQKQREQRTKAGLPSNPERDSLSQRIEADIVARTRKLKTDSNAVGGTKEKIGEKRLALLAFLRVRFGDDFEPPPAVGSGPRPPVEPSGPPGEDFATLKRAYESIKDQTAKPAPIPAQFQLETSSEVVSTKDVQRPTLKVWGHKGKAVPYADIVNLKSMNVVPGGVALGATLDAKKIRADTDIHLSKFGLRYLPRMRKLALIGPSGGPILSPEVDPGTLRACLRFAVSKSKDTRGAEIPDSVVVSIGYSGDERDILAGGEFQKVLLHPALRDSQVGRDAIDSDRLPWSLAEARWPNQYDASKEAAEMKPLLDKVLKAKDPIAAALLDKVGKFTKGIANADAELSTQSGRNRLIRMATSDDEGHLFLRIARIVASGNKDRLSAFKDADRPKLPAKLKQLIQEKADESGRSASEVEEVFRREILGSPELQRQLAKRAEFAKSLIAALPPDRDSALVSLAFLAVETSKDATVPWNVMVKLTILMAAAGKIDSMKLAANEILELLSPANLSLITDESVGLQVQDGRFSWSAALKVRFVHSKLDALPSGIRHSSKPQDEKVAGEQATKLLVEAEKNYPALGRLRDAAGLIAFLRWATSGNVAWVDLADLDGVEIPAVPTPDYLCKTDNCADKIRAGTARSRDSEVKEE